MPFLLLLLIVDEIFGAAQLGPKCGAPSLQREYLLLTRRRAGWPWAWSECHVERQLHSFGVTEVSAHLSSLLNRISYYQRIMIS